MEFFQPVENVLSSAITGNIPSRKIRLSKVHSEAHSSCFSVIGSLSFYAKAISWLCGLLSVGLLSVGFIISGLGRKKSDLFVGPIR